MLQEAQDVFAAIGARHYEGLVLVALAALIIEMEKQAGAKQLWQAAQAKLHPDSPASRAVAEQLMLIKESV